MAKGKKKPKKMTRIWAKGHYAGIGNTGWINSPAGTYPGPRTVISPTKRKR